MNIDEIVIEPVKVRHLPAFLAAVEPIAVEMASGDMLSAVAKHCDAVIQATVIGAGVERAWLDEQGVDTLVELASRVIEVNADFFARRVLPALSRAAQAIAQSAGGTTGSSVSSAPDSATPT